MVSRSRLKSLLTGLALYAMAAAIVGYFSANAYTGQYGLNAQQELVNARVALVTAQRDRVVASYTLLSAVGRLSIPVLGLQVPIYDPMTHYQQIRDAWTGVRTPDGQ